MSGAESYNYQRYMKDISRFPRISNEREAELSRIIIKSKSKAKVENAVNELVQANLLLVIHCLKDFAKYITLSGNCISVMDLVAEGNIGLMNAAKKFNVEYSSGDEKAHKRPISFSAYACKCIKTAMRRALKSSRFIHIPEHHFAYWTKINKLQELHGDDLTDEIIVEQLEITPSRLAMLKKSQQCKTSGLEEISECDGQSRWFDVMPNPKAECPERQAALSDLKKHLLEEISTLPPRTQKMLSMMFLEERKTTLGDLSQRFGISRERCRQICAKGLQTLKNQIETKFSVKDDFSPARVDNIFSSLEMVA
jgi:RNA polymerase sigma-32 factor